MALTGGCQCGAVRYEATGESIGHALCHCEGCRASAGAPAVGWMMFPEDSVKVTKGEPKSYNSSGSAYRHFCENCGTGGALYQPRKSARPYRYSISNVRRCRRASTWCANSGG